MIGVIAQVIPAVLAVVSLGFVMLMALRQRKIAQAVEGALQRPPEPKQDSVSEALSELRIQLSELGGRIAALEAAPQASEAEAVLPFPIRAGMNLNKRTQALRQYRLGHGSKDIAKSLEMPKAEVDLLIKVHKLVS